MYRDDIEIAGRFLDIIFNNLTLLLISKAGVLGAVDGLDRVKSSLSIGDNIRRVNLYLTGDRVIVEG